MGSHATGILREYNCASTTRATFEGHMEEYPPKETGRVQPVYRFARERKNLLLNRLPV